MVTLMNGLDRARFAPVFLTISDEGPLRAQIAPDIPFHSLNGKRVSRSIPHIYRALSALRPDVVVSTMAHMNFAMLLLRPLFPRISFLVREAALPSLIFQSRRSMAWGIRIAYRLLYPMADLVISPAQPIMNEFSALGLPMKNHVLLHNFVDTAKIRDAGAINTPRDAAPHKDTVSFIAAGQFYWPKGFDRLIENLPRIHMPYDWHITILGDGRDRAMLEKLIQDNNLSHHVSLPGFFANPWPFYAKADCFLLPSRSEGMPNVVLESLACGTPVIASRDAGGITDIARLSAPGAVTIAPDMTSFIRAMENIKPLAKTAISPSLLPDDFTLDNALSRFSGLIESACNRRARKNLGKN